MQLDVIIPTYNRQDLLQRTLKSLLTAEVPSSLEVRVIVVDNNSKDETRRVVESYVEAAEGRLLYVFEGRQGRSYALNAGIEAATGDLVGMIDDDEEIDSQWYQRAFSAFQDEQLDFIGGPYVPRWGAAQPPWLPKEYPAVIGWIDSGNEVQEYGPSFAGMLMGGNVVMRRSILKKVGSYATSLGRNSKQLMSGEDQDMYERLLAAGARGLYLPDLIIYHYVPPERLKKSYYRRWCFWNNVSLGLIDRERQSTVVYLLGVPRWMIGRGVRSAIRLLVGSFKEKNPARSFSNELACWDLAGFFYGKHFFKRRS